LKLKYALQSHFTFIARGSLRAEFYINEGYIGRNSAPTLQWLGIYFSPRREKRLKNLVAWSTYVRGMTATEEIGAYGVVRSNPAGYKVVAL
jgi:hypothetical protein